MPPSLDGGLEKNNTSPSLSSPRKRGEGALAPARKKLKVPYIFIFGAEIHKGNSIINEVQAEFVATIDLRAIRKIETLQNPKSEPPNSTLYVLSTVSDVGEPVIPIELVELASPSISVKYLPDKMFSLKGNYIYYKWR